MNMPFCKTWVFISLELLHLSHGGLLHDFRLPPQVNLGIASGMKRGENDMGKTLPIVFPPELLLICFTDEAFV